MRGRKGARASAIVALAVAVPLIGAQSASAAQSWPSDDECGFHLWRQAYTNCSTVAEGIEIRYQSWGPGAWVRTKVNWCIRPGETAGVTIPDGNIAIGGSARPLEWCDSSTMNNHPER